MKLLYLIGVPGSGKSTLTRELTRGITAVQHQKPVAHIRYPACGVIQLGALRESFSGTDAMAMNVQRMVQAFLDTRPAEYVYAEGDRLANGKFFQWCVDNGIELTVAYLDVPDTVVEFRRSKRGSHQSATWLKGRTTKVAKLRNEWAKVSIHGATHPEDAAEELADETVVGRVLWEAGHVGSQT